MNSHNDTGLLLSVLACNLNIVMIKLIKGYFKKTASSSKTKHATNS